MILLHRMSLLCLIAVVAGCEPQGPRFGLNDVANHNIQQQSNYDGASQLYEQLTHSQDRTLDERLGAAQALLARLGSDATPWIILVLSRPEALDAIGEESDLGWLRHSERDLPVIAYLLMKLPNNCDRSLLLALLFLLEDDRRTGYDQTVESDFGEEITATSITETMRELARRVLVKNLSVDNRYDVMKWRKHIMSKK